MPKSGEKGPVLIPQILVPAPTPAQYLTSMSATLLTPTPCGRSGGGRKSLMLPPGERLRAAPFATQSDNRSCNLPD